MLEQLNPDGFSIVGCPIPAIIRSVNPHGIGEEAITNWCLRCKADYIKGVVPITAITLHVVPKEDSSKVFDPNFVYKPPSQ